MRVPKPMFSLIGVLVAIACDQPFVVEPLLPGAVVPVVPVVPVTPAAAVTITVTAGSPTLSVGDTTRVTALVKDASGAVMSGAPVVWASSAPTIVRVANDGAVSALGAGSATVTATSAGQSAKAPITVLAPVAPPATPPVVSSDTGAIRLRIQRFDGASGNVLVSNAIPLPAGRLRPNQVSLVRVFVRGVEKAVYVEGLEGLHPGGSLRSVLVQFNHSVASGEIIEGELVLGARRATTDIAKPAAVRGTSVAAALPVDPNYLISTNLVGPTLSVDSTAVMGAVYRRYDADFVQWANYHWTTSGDAWNDGYYYDRALVYYAAWMRSGNPEYWYRANRMAVSYRTGYLSVSKYEAPPQWSFVEGLSLHYWLTGDETSRSAVGAEAEYLWRAYGRGMSTTGIWDTEGRIAGRVLQSYLFAHLLNLSGQRVTGNEFPAWDVLLSSGLSMILPIQGADGAVRPESYCRQSSNFSSGILNDVLIQYYSYFSADERIVTWMRRSSDFLRTQWDPQAKAFRYISGTCAAATGDPTGLAGDLNNLMVNTFAWTYMKTGLREYRDIADQVFEGALINGYPSGGKQFNQQYAASYRYLAFRR